MKLVKSAIKAIKRVPFISKFSRCRESEKPLRNDLFDLAPVDDADQDGLYQDALEFAMKTSAIRNVAITGPYGSGKTSVIKTFEKNTSYRFLNVSLATFSDPNARDKQGDDQADTTVKVERSILQQMLYGAGSGTLPYSRFKRISAPRWLDINAILFVGWITSIGLLYQKHDDLLKAFDTGTLGWEWIFTAAYALLYLARLVSKAMQASHSLSIKKLSLQSGEVELDGVPESSILNKYLDEIIYFFEANNYDLVVFEDLDRFGNPEIFIKLREINKIINDRPCHRLFRASPKQAQPLKFIYAIKDDIFLNKDRAKFFDFIIPIIPIINNSNSRELLERCIHSAGYQNTINDRFIGEVSLYLDDMRLIKNISNEFLIYEKKIGSGKLNPSRLLAAIIYKNTYPQDFENLHHGNGALFETVQRRSALLAQSAERIDSEIEALRNLIAESDDESHNDVADLIKAFWGHLCSLHSEYDIISINSGSSTFTLQQLLEWSNFERLFEEKNLTVQGSQRSTTYLQVRNIPLSISFKSIEEEMSPGATLRRRRQRILNKKTKTRSDLNRSIEALKAEKSTLARLPLYELLKSVRAEIEEITERHEILDSRLLHYLIRSGHIDETYHLYISIFHEGRMSRNDWDFILDIRDFKTPEPLQIIDNPAEVMSELREEDFGSGNTLNIYIVDHQIGNESGTTSRIRLIVEYLSKNLQNATQFFEAYWLAGKHSEKLTQIVSDLWANYGIASIGTPLANQHIARILAHVDPAYVAEAMNTDNALSDYISTNASVILSENFIFAHGYQTLKLLNIRVGALDSVSDLTQAADYIYENDLYPLSITNVILLLETKFTQALDDDETYLPLASRKANYAAILTQTDTPLSKYVDREINTYIRDVACALGTNSEEPPEVIIKLVNHPKVDAVLALQYTLQQKHVFSGFEELPTYLWTEMVYNEKISTTWPNLISLIGLDELDENKLIEFLGRPSTYQMLSADKIPLSDETSETTRTLSWLIISSTALNTEAYQALCNSISYYYKTFPDNLPGDRKLILAKSGIVNLNDQSFAATQSSLELRAMLIQQKFYAYKTAVDQYPLDDESKSLLLASNLSSANKYFLTSRITLEELNTNTSLARIVGQLLGDERLEDKNFDLGLVTHCLTTNPNQTERVNILYNFVDLLPITEVVQVLSGLDAPYSDLAKKRKRPKFKATVRNKQFGASLVKRTIISSVTSDGDHIRLNTYR
ncbi:hypothetical protein NLO72_21910 [Pseudomonas tremae]|uniref:YobI family P-loop NTPase n=1 Tax=Pseudomonas tremae TaxID=200454 RepID=UPI002108E427|nr:hypothetical protein [Pseudomonas tremae]MCQ2991865.1 hypothetical protein [Pseudomonas tremae]